MTVKGGQVKRTKSSSIIKFCESCICLMSLSTDNESTMTAKRNLSPSSSSTLIRIIVYVTRCTLIDPFITWLIVFVFEYVLHPVYLVKQLLLVIYHLLLHWHGGHDVGLHEHLLSQGCVCECITINVEQMYRHRWITINRWIYRVILRSQFLVTMGERAPDTEWTDAVTVIIHAPDSFVVWVWYLVWLFSVRNFRQWIVVLPEFSCAMGEWTLDAEVTRASGFVEFAQAGFELIVRVVHYNILIHHL